MDMIRIVCLLARLYAKIFARITKRPWLALNFSTLGSKQGSERSNLSQKVLLLAGSTIFNVFFVISEALDTCVSSVFFSFSSSQGHITFAANCGPFILLPRYDAISEKYFQLVYVLVN